MTPPTRPNFLIVGAARSGTTALARTLSQHPDVFITEPKEVHFFSHADRPIRYRGPGDDVTMNRRLVTDPDRYLDLYRRAGTARVRGEGSVSTLYYPDRSIPAIERHADDGVKLIAILREPADRAYSAYLYLRGRGFEPCPTFEEALALESERKRADYHHMWHLRAMSRYRDQLAPFAERFGDRFVVLIAEEYRADPAMHLRRLCRFLDIDEDHRFVADDEVNQGGEPRSRIVAGAMNRLRSVGAARTAVRALTSDRLRERVRRANLDRPPADDDTIADLRAELAPDVAAVRQLLGRPIPAWPAP